MRHFSIAVFTAALTFSLATGCKGKESAPAKSSATAAKDTGPQRGGHIKLPSNEPRFMNPVLETRFDRANLLVFEGLIGLDARMEAVPRLAKSWEVSADGKTITFKLRDNVSWHDGEKFTARDVAFTFESIRNTTAPTLWKGYLVDVEKLETPDDYTVVVNYSRPYAPALMTWTLGIIPKHVYGEGDLAENPGNKEPVGTGPFKMGRWELGRRMIMQANDTWWYGRPYIDTLELDFSQRTDADLLAALKSGELDFATINDIGEWTNRAQVAEFRESFEVSDVIESRFRVIAWNTQRAPFDQAAVRQGLTMALNRSRVIDDMLFGQAQPLSAPFFANMFGADPSIGPHPFDLEKAGALLGAPGPDGKRFAIDLIAVESQRGPLADGTMAIFRNDLRALGVDLKVSYLPTKEYFERIVMRNFDAAYFGWLPDIPDPDPYALLHSSQIGGGPNYAGYANPEVDKLLDDARIQADREARKGIYHQLHKILHNELPYTTLYAPYGHYAWSRRLRGVNPRDIGPSPLFPGIARWWVVPAPHASSAKPIVR